MHATASRMLSCTAMICLDDAHTENGRKFYDDLKEVLSGV